MILCGNPGEAYLAHREEIDEAISSVLTKGIYILGNEVKLFEEEFAKFSHTKFAIGVGSGTDALHLSLRAFNVSRNDEVITVSHTAVATVSAIVQCGAKPVFVDIDPLTFTMDPSKIEKDITSKTKAIIPVHIYGHPVNLEPIINLCKKYSLHLIEDCAQAHGALYNGKRVGSIGDVGCFSFYPTKNLGGVGDGGMITTNSEEIYNQLKLLREYGWKERYISHINGFNSRLDSVQAAVLRVKLKHLDNDNQKRREIAAVYDSKLKDSDLMLPPKASYAEHVYHLYVVRSSKRDLLKDFLLKNDIMALIHYPVPVHKQKAYLSLEADPMEVTEKYAGEILSLPMYPELREEEIDHVVKTIYKFR
jgi:dTDP-4-amino-4,6-dideoxygalactose transaminase